MDVGVEATQERLPDALSKSPASAHELAAHGDGMDAGVEATQERLPDARRAPIGVAFSFTPGILPSALRAGFAVRAAPAAQWLLFSWPRKRKVTRSPQAIDRFALGKNMPRMNGAYLSRHSRETLFNGRRIGQGETQRLLQREDTGFPLSRE